MLVRTNWTDFKSIVAEKGLRMQYQEGYSSYIVFAQEDMTEYRCDLNKDSGADVTDFEDNYKDNANLPVLLGEDKIFDDEAIRDTNLHTSNISDNRGFIPKTILVENGLDEDVEITIYGSRYSDFSVELQLGVSFNIGAETDDFATVTDYFPFMRAKAQCTSAPSSGTLNIWIERVKA
jgi:hypothetical protein